MTADQTAQSALRANSISRTQETSKEKLVICATEYLQMVHCAPELTFFMKNYIVEHQADILSIDPSKKGSTSDLRRLLATLVHESLDALLADVQVLVKARKPSIAPEDNYASESISDLEESEEIHVRHNELGVKVKFEMEQLVQVAKDNVDEQLLRWQSR